MALKLEDLLSKKKEPNQILDLAKVKIRSKDEFERYFDKIPEFKIRPEKLRTEDIRLRDTEFSFKLTKKEGRHKPFPYSDPVPLSMKSVRLDDLAAVDISWRMLTMLRPKNRLEEDIFSRLVELGKLRLGTRNWEAKQLASASGGAPGSQSNALMASMGLVVVKSKRGGVETRIKVCKECGLELCTGAFCKEFPYESYTRLMLDKDELEEDEGGANRRGSKSKKAGGKGSKVVKTKVSRVSKGGKKLVVKRKKPKDSKEAVEAGALVDGDSAVEVDSAAPAAAGGKIKVKKKRKRKRKLSKKGPTSSSDTEGG